MTTFADAIKAYNGIKQEHSVWVAIVDYLGLKMVDADNSLYDEEGRKITPEALGAVREKVKDDILTPLEGMLRVYEAKAMEVGNVGTAPKQKGTKSNGEDNEKSKVTPSNQAARKSPVRGVRRVGALKHT